MSYISLLPCHGGVQASAAPLTGQAAVRKPSAVLFGKPTWPHGNARYVLSVHERRDERAAVLARKSRSRSSRADGLADLESETSARLGVILSRRGVHGRPKELQPASASPVKAATG